MQEGITAAALLAGFIFGNVIWGFVADKVAVSLQHQLLTFSFSGVQYGRRPCIMMSVFGVGLFNSMAAFGQLWWHVAALRVVVVCDITVVWVPS